MDDLDPVKVRDPVKVHVDRTMRAGTGATM